MAEYGRRAIYTGQEITEEGHTLRPDTYGRVNADPAVLDDGVVWFAPDDGAYVFPVAADEVEPMDEYSGYEQAMGFDN